MNKNIVNGIVILDAIPDGELNTARRLKEDLQDLAYTLSKTLEVRYIRLNSYSDLENGIFKLLKEVKESGLVPWLHLEGHGSPDEAGFQLGNGHNCSWEQLKELVTPLNIITDLNTLLILATCYGGTFVKTISTTDRAPVSGLIGPKHEVKVGEVEKGFIALYKTFFETGSLKNALVALQETAPEGLYYRTTAERFFYEVWCSYKQVQCTKAELEKRARRMRNAAKAQKIGKLPSIGYLKRFITKQEPILFDKYRDTYFLYDITDTTRERYPVTYKEAEKKCGALTRR